MKRPVAKISNLSQRLATFASDVIDHSRRSPTFASRCFASSLNATAAKMPADRALCVKANKSKIRKCNTANQDLMLWRNTFSSAQYCDEANYYGLVKHLNDLKNKNLQQLHETNWKFSFIWLRLLSTLSFKIWLWTKKRLSTTAIDVWS